ncbi:Protein T08H10.1 [Aphelenchoides avenae]|nr:Protein T08H10.1 [Aphelenchus avenae]
MTSMGKAIKGALCWSKDAYRKQNGELSEERSGYFPPKSTVMTEHPGLSPTLTMWNGVHIPMVGLGTWEANPPEKLKEALRCAFDAGYRLIDTAYFYGNEHIIGEVIEEYTTQRKLTRAELFITTKLAPFYYRPDKARECLQMQLKNLRTHYIDLFLMHTPMPMQLDEKTKFSLFGPNGEWMCDDYPLTDTWRMMEQFYYEGYARAIGISNFNERQIREVFAKAEIKPMNHQIEVNLLWPNYELVKFSKRMGMTVTGYCCLGSPGRQAAVLKDDWPDGNCLTHPTVTRLAAKHSRTPAQVGPTVVRFRSSLMLLQVILRQILQRGVISVVKSQNPRRIRENFGIFDFELDADDMAAFEAITERVRLFPFKFVIHHPFYPFDDVKE